MKYFKICFVVTLHLAQTIQPSNQAPPLTIRDYTGVYNPDSNDVYALNLTTSEIKTLSDSDMTNLQISNENIATLHSEIAQTPKWIQQKLPMLEQDIEILEKQQQKQRTETNFVFKALIIASQCIKKEPKNSQRLDKLKEIQRTNRQMYQAKQRQLAITVIELEELHYLRQWYKQHPCLTQATPPTSQMTWISCDPSKCAPSRLFSDIDR